MSLGFLLACCSCALAQDASLDVSQYAHHAWTVREGFSKGRISAIVQSPDGYLWLGTEFGLLRFDGVRTVPWESLSHEQLPSGVITHLLVTPDGTLWIGTLKGLVSWKDGKLTRYPAVADVIINALLEDKQGRVWLGTAEVSGRARLCSILSGKIECYGAGTFGRTVLTIHQDNKGNLWVAGTDQLWRWTPGSPQRYLLPARVAEINSIMEDDNGALVLATTDGLKQLAGEKIQSYALPSRRQELRPATLLRSRDGALWIGSVQGLFHLHHGKLDAFRSTNGLSADAVLGIFEDREGNIWVGTTGGLDRFHNVAVPSITQDQGLSNSSAIAIQASADGSIWIASNDGLNRWRNGHVDVYGGGKTLQKLRQVTTIADSGLTGGLRSLGQDDLGRLWAATADGVFCFENGRFVRVPGLSGETAFSIVGDGHGGVWTANGGTGLSHWNPAGTVQQIPAAQFSQKFARTLAADPQGRGVWVGFYEGGIAYVENGEVRASFGPAQGVSGRVIRLRFGSRGALWAATEAGLTRIKDGQVMTLTSNNGLPCDEVHWSMEDTDQHIWVYMPCGLLRIARSELDAWVGDSKRAVQFTQFDNSDGVRTIAVYGSSGPHVTKSADGKIWFAHSAGVSFIDPHRLSFNSLPPPLHIEQITADDKKYDFSNSLRLPAHVRNLDIDYTALSLVVP